MGETVGKLSVFFEDPFWVGVLERVEGEMLSACKITFGAEPRDYEVEAFLREHYYKLRFSPGITVESKAAEHKNPKRVQRAARRETLKQGVGTKSQQAMKLLQEIFISCCLKSCKVYFLFFHNVFLQIVDKIC